MTKLVTRWNTAAIFSSALLISVSICIKSFLVDNQTNGIVSGIIFVALGLLFTFFQWLFPFDATPKISRMEGFICMICTILSIVTAFLIITNPLVDEIIGIKTVKAIPTTVTVAPSSTPTSGQPSTQAVKVPFAVYTDHGDTNNHYFPSNPAPTGNGNIISDDNWTEKPHQGITCIKVVYKGLMPGKTDDWAGLELLDPSGNWGTVPNEGYNLSQASRLSFWARGNSGGEHIVFQMGGAGYDANRVVPLADSLPSQQTELITLTTQWQHISIPLKVKGKNLDLTHVIGGFALSVTTPDNPNGATFYLDDIIYI